MLYIFGMLCNQTLYMLILLTKSVKNGIVCLSSTVISINDVLFESFEETRSIQLLLLLP